MLALIFRYRRQFFKQFFLLYLMDNTIKIVKLGHPQSELPLFRRASECCCMHCCNGLWRRTKLSQNTNLEVLRRKREDNEKTTIWCSSQSRGEKQKKKCCINGGSQRIFHVSNKKLSQSDDNQVDANWRWFPLISSCVFLRDLIFYYIDSRQYFEWNMIKKMLGSNHRW